MRHTFRSSAQALAGLCSCKQVLSQTIPGKSYFQKVSCELPFLRMPTEITEMKLRCSMLVGFAILVWLNNAGRLRSFGFSSNPLCQEWRKHKTQVVLEPFTPREYPPEDGYGLYPQHHFRAMKNRAGQSIFPQGLVNSGSCSAHQIWAAVGSVELLTYNI